jgi:hypothetical protein
MPRRCMLDVVGRQLDGRPIALVTWDLDLRMRQPRYFHTRDEAFSAATTCHWPFSVVDVTVRPPERLYDPDTYDEIIWRIRRETLDVLD